MVQLEPPDLHRRHAEIGEPAGDDIYGREVHQRQVVPEFRVAVQPLVIVEEVTTADRAVMISFTSRGSPERLRRIPECRHLDRERLDGVSVGDDADD